MASSFQWARDTGAATGSPSKGTTRTVPVTDGNWKSVDDATTSASAAPVIAGTNSYETFVFGKFTGTFTELSNGLWAHTGGTFGTGLSLSGIVTSTYTTPSQTANAALTEDMTTAISIGSGQTVLFSTTGPEDASPTATLAASGYTQFLATQLQATVAATPGGIGTLTLTLQWDEV